MTQLASQLSAEQRSAIFNAMALRESDFLEVCFKTLRPGSDHLLPPYGEIYELLVRGQLNKLEALRCLLVQLGFDLPEYKDRTARRYNIEMLIDFSPGDNQKFVSLLMDFFADRPPTTDEALQFEHMLRSGRASRADLLKILVKRYQPHFVIEGADILAFEPVNDLLTISQKCRGITRYHAETILGSEPEHKVGALKPADGLYLSYRLHLPQAGEWNLLYKIAQDGTQKLEIEIRDIASNSRLCAAEASRNLVGTLIFEPISEGREVQILVTHHEEQEGESAAIIPELIKLRPG